MDPQIANKLMQDVPEIREFVRYLASCALELKNIDNVPTVIGDTLIIEFYARKKAYEILVKMLDPLINAEVKKVEKAPTGNDFGI